MKNLSFLEDHISQIPALQMLIKLGYKYLSPLEALQLRGDKTNNIILDDVLRNQLKKINTYNYWMSKTNVFTDGSIETWIQAIKDIPFNEGYISATEYIYNLLTLGKTVEQVVEGDKKSYNLRYIDWKHPENNVFHVTEEYSVMRTWSKDHYRPDIVLFVNGIPFCVIECKRPDIKDPIKQAISQQIRNQQEDWIRSLYVYSQLNLVIATDFAKYWTAWTGEKFWSLRKEKFESDKEEAEYEKNLLELKNKKLSDEVKDKLFSDRFKYVRKYFDDQEEKEILPTEQDRYLVALCKPERLLELAFWYIVYDNNIKKIARYQQYFAIKKTVEKVSVVKWWKREWWVIRHTQWSWKSLTMVMLAGAIANVKSIRNPKIIIVTDRTDLDKQISDTFKKCWRVTDRATTWWNLVELLESKSDAIVTTVINKFETAIKKIKKPLESYDIFVLVDEWHRTQYWEFNLQMQRTLPNACFIAMTWTPLMKKEKSTAKKFGWIIDSYTVNQAVEDKAVVPLLYEWRHATQTVDVDDIDRYFARIAWDLTDKQKADLKKKFARKDQLNVADKRIYEIAWDVSCHFRDTWQWTWFKWQLVCQSKESAIKYKNYLDEIWLVTSEVLISAPDDREWEDDVYEKAENSIVKRYRETKIKEFWNAKKYEDAIISRFKNQDEPEIIIVVDKLLTWFDAPRNVVLYLTRGLKWHTLLQAIARVNRVADWKDFWYIIDYYWVLEELDEALVIYWSDKFDEKDLEWTMINIDVEIKKLSQKYSDLWDIFKSIENKSDLEAFEVLLKDEEKRDYFYNKYREYSKTLQIALSSTKIYDELWDKQVEKYKNDLLMFHKLRRSVAARYSDEIDYSKYEVQIQKLIDAHIDSWEAKTIVKPVNIFEKEAFSQEVKKVVWETAKADTIASRTKKYIQEKMDEDPAFYKKFSEMLQDTIKDYEEHRISEKEYLAHVTKIMDDVLNHSDWSFPDEVKESDVAKAIYWISNEFLSWKNVQTDKIKEIAIMISLGSDQIIKDLKIVNWQNNKDVINKMKLAISDMIYDEVKSKYNVWITLDEIDLFVDKCIWIAKLRY